MNWGQANTGTGEFSFTQPIISTNGVVGGSNFAVEASSERTVNTAWKAFDGDSTTAANSWLSVSTTGVQWLTFYNPNALKISKLIVYGYPASSGTTSYYIKNAIVQGSNDNTNWTDLTTFGNASWVSSYTVNVNSSDYYKYHRIYITDRSWYNQYYQEAIITEIKITATYISTASNTITFPCSHSNTNYSYSLSYLNGISGNSYATQLTNSNLYLQNNSSAAVVYYSTIGY